MIAYYGEHVWPTHGAPSIASIGVGLGRMPRFAGQTREWYPVLSHVLVVAELVRPETRIHALLHDAAEAIVSDVPTTWKTDAAKANEEIILDRIYESLGIEPATLDEARDVEWADRVTLIAEARTLGHADPSAFPLRRDISEGAVGEAGRHTYGELRKCRDYLEPMNAAHRYKIAVRDALAEHRAATA